MLVNERMKHNASDRSKLAGNVCTVTLEEQQIMKRNEKQQISVKTINIFNIFYYIINGPNIRTLAKLLLGTYLLRGLVFVNMKVLIL